MKGGKNKMNLKNRIKKELTWALILASPLLLPNLMNNVVTRASLHSGFSREFIEKQYREENPKERPYIGSVVDFVSRPGRELAYLTNEQYKFPWRGYARNMFR